MGTFVTHRLLCVFASSSIFDEFRYVSFAHPKTFLYLYHYNRSHRWSVTGGITPLPRYSLCYLTRNDELVTRRPVAALPQYL